MSDLQANQVEIIIYTTPLCGYCMMAKRLLRSRGLNYEEKNASGAPELRAWLVEQTGQRTVPQIFINGQSIGGFTELSALDRTGELMKIAKI